MSYRISASPREIKIEKLPLFLRFKKRIRNFFGLIRGKIKEIEMSGIMVMIIACLCVAGIGYAQDMDLGQATKIGISCGLGLFASYLTIRTFIRYMDS